MEGGYQCLQSGWDGKVIVKHLGLRAHRPLWALLYLWELRYEPKLPNSPLCFTVRNFPTSWDISLAEPQRKIKEKYYSSDLEKSVFDVSIQRPIDPHEKATSELHRAAIGGIGNQGAAHPVSGLLVQQSSVTAVVAVVLM